MDEIMSNYNTSYHIVIIEKYLSNNRYTKDKNNNVLELVDPKGEDVILEIGCSSGGSTFLCASAGSTVMGVDTDSEAIAVAEEYKPLVLKDTSQCRFATGRGEDFLEELPFNKVIMIDFVEHIDDNSFRDLIDNIFLGLPGAMIYIYTPNRLHVFEWLKAHNIILKEDLTHIGLRSTAEIKKVLEEAGAKIDRSYFRSSHIPLFSFFEGLFSKIPVAGELFRRRICIRARVPDQDIKVDNIPPTGETPLSYGR